MTIFSWCELCRKQLHKQKYQKRKAAVSWFHFFSQFELKNSFCQGIKFSRFSPVKLKNMWMMFSLPAMKFIIGCFFLDVIIVTIARGEESYLEDLADEESAGKTCPIYPPPENGALAITYLGSDPLCIIQCRTEYDFKTTPPALYLCDRGTWKFISLFGNTDTSLPWPNCASERHVIPVFFVSFLLKASLQTWNECLPFFPLFCRMLANTIKP